MPSTGGVGESELDTLVDEVRLLWNTLVRWGERLHEDEPVTIGMRAVLEFLSRNGPTTVPNIARARRVTRQQIQALVNPLRKAGLVEAAPNPAHRRSSLIRLTAAGSRTIARMRRRERAAIAAGGPPAAAGELRRAARTLRAVRSRLEEGLDRG